LRFGIGDRDAVPQRGRANTGGREPRIALVGRAKDVPEDCLERAHRRIERGPCIDEDRLRGRGQLIALSLKLGR
jgi:hypothetical protein